MDLAYLWFWIVGFLFVGYFVLDGFDFGVGMLLPILAKNDTERRVLINTIGPVWDGNEVWVLVAGGDVGVRLLGVTAAAAGRWTAAAAHPKFTMLPARLASAGYVSHQIGKWHLGPGAADGPLSQGFDEFVPKDWYKGWPKAGYFAPFQMDGLDSEKDAYLTDAPIKAKALSQQGILNYTVDKDTYNKILEVQ